MGTPFDVREWDYLGTPVYLGQDCPLCETEHYCDAICFRFKPTIFYCGYCKVHKRHTPFDRLMRSYQASKLLKGLTTT